MKAQSAVVSQRYHQMLTSVGLVVQVPGSAVSVLPARGVPVIDGPASLVAAHASSEIVAASHFEDRLAPGRLRRRAGRR